MNKPASKPRALRRLLLVLGVAIAAVLVVPVLRRDLVTTPLTICWAEWQLGRAKTAAEEKSAIETATKIVPIWSIGPANAEEVPAYVANQIPKVVLIRWSECNPLTGEPYRTTHRLVSESNWVTLERGRISDR